MIDLLSFYITNIIIFSNTYMFLVNSNFKKYYIYIYLKIKRKIRVLKNDKYEVNIFSKSTLINVKAYSVRPCFNNNNNTIDYNIKFVIPYCINLYT